MQSVSFERHGVVFQYAVQFGSGIRRVRAEAHFDTFAERVGRFCGDGFLRGEYAFELGPVVRDALLFEFVADGVDNPVGQ